MPEDNTTLPQWDASAWLGRFNAAAASRHHGALHELRKDVYRSTIGIIRSGYYITQRGTRIILPDPPEAHARSRFYRRELAPLLPKQSGKPNIQVKNEDCLLAAANCGWDEVCILNLANRRTPGGGVLQGCGAQEEYLFRCSDYFRSLYQFHSGVGDMFGIKQAVEQYPMDRDFGAIYTRGVTVFRAPEEEGYALLEKPFSVNMIAVAAINRPSLRTMPDGEERLTAPMVEGTLNKIRTIFRVAADNGQRRLILGALGCGAFRNPPQHMAELFRAVLREPEFQGAFTDIIFAIKEDHNSRRRGNFQPFAETFSSPSSTRTIQEETLTEAYLFKHFPMLDKQLREFLLDPRPLYAWELPHQLTYPLPEWWQKASSLRVSELPRLFKEGHYRYHPGGHGPFRGFLMSENRPELPVFHMESHGEVLYPSERVRRLHRLVVTEGHVLC